MSEMLEKILGGENVLEACRRVCANKGADGADGFSADDLAEYLWENWNGTNPN